MDRGDLDGVRAQIQQVMTEKAGVVRSADSLRAAERYLDAVPALPSGRGGWELTNLVTVGRALVAAAQAREETRGAHTRSDHPDRDGQLGRRRFLSRDGRA